MGWKGRDMVVWGVKERKRERDPEETVPQLCGLHVLLCLVPRNQGDPPVNSSSDCFNSDTPSEQGTQSRKQKLATLVAAAVVIVVFEQHVPSVQIYCNPTHVLNL